VTGLCAVIGLNAIAGLMVRYWGVGTELSNDEREVLLIALATENEALGGQIHRDAATLLKAKLGATQNGPEIPQSAGL